MALFLLPTRRKIATIHRTNYGIPLISHTLPCCHLDVCGNLRFDKYAYIIPYI